MDRNVTEAELLEELKQAFGDAGPDDARTIREIAELLDLSLETTRNRIRPLVQGGRMEVVKVRRPRLDGLVVPVSAYRLIG